MNPNPNLNVSETKTGKSVIENTPDAFRIGQTVTGRRMNRRTSRWEPVTVRITGQGKEFAKTFTQYVIDEDYSHDGQRKVSSHTATVCYWYVEVVA